MKVTIVGLGLIGGSVALDMRKAGFASVLTGVDVQSAHAREAERLGLIDHVLPEDQAVGQADLVILAIPVNALSALLPSILDTIGDNTVVIDMGSTKGQICRSVGSHSKRKQFVASHPLAGTENSGPQAALHGLFAGKTNIICEKEKSSDEALDLAVRLFDMLGMRTIFMEPDEHDKHVAYVSHLSHVSAFLLGNTVLDIEKDEKNIFNMAGSGFASTVRLAKSSPEMWTPIFEQNMENLSQALMEYIMNLQKFHYHLMKRDTKEMTRILSRANDIRRVLEGMEVKSAEHAALKIAKTTEVKIK